MHLNQSDTLRHPRDKLRPVTHRGGDSRVSSWCAPGDIFESDLEVGIPKKGPLRPHKAKVLPLNTVLRCAGQSSPGTCPLPIVRSLPFVHLVAQVFCLSPLRRLSQTLGLILRISVLGVPQCGADTIDPLTRELGGASESHLSSATLSRVSFQVLF